MLQKYKNRREAGKILASYLTHYKNQPNVIVLALPRGGVPVAFEVAKFLSAPLDVFIVRKLGVPGHSELAMGALALGGEPVFNQDVIEYLQIGSAEIQAVIAKEEQELQRREITYRGYHPFPLLQDKSIILIDDGIATGASMRAAVLALKQHNPAIICVAVPVAETQIGKQMAALVDEFICPFFPPAFNAVGTWYEDFSQTEDEEVHMLLEEARLI